MNRLDAGPVSNARTGRPTREPAWQSLGGGLGYIEVPGFAGGSQQAQADFASALQTIIVNLDAAGGCGWIVDLRGNRGGNLWPMLAGIGPLLEPGEAGAALYPNGRRQSFWYRDGRVGLGEYTQLRVRAPQTIANREAPVAVLTDGATASAAEILTVALRARPNSRTFGEPTRGAHSATRVYPLDDDAAIVLAVAATVNARGDRFEGPIAPDVRVAAANLGDRPGGDPAREPVVGAAIAWLHTASACTP
jgi:C-terminal processing protease CtpA/Prc